MSTSPRVRWQDANAQDSMSYTVIPINIIDLACSSDLPIADELLKLADATGLAVEIALPSVFSKSDSGRHRFIYLTKKLVRVKKIRKNKLNSFFSDFRYFLMPFLLFGFIYRFSKKNRTLRKKLGGDRKINPNSFSIKAVIGMTAPVNLASQSVVEIYKKSLFESPRIMSQQVTTERSLPEVEKTPENLKKSNAIQSGKITYSEKIRQIGFFKASPVASSIRPNAVNHIATGLHLAPVNPPAALPNHIIFPAPTPPKPAIAPRLR